MVQLLKKDPTTKHRAETLKQLKALKENEVINNKLYYCLKPTDLPVPRFKVNQNTQARSSFTSYVSNCGFRLCTILTNAWLTLWQLMLKTMLTHQELYQVFELHQKCSNRSWRDNGIVWSHFLVHEHCYSWCVKYNQELC